MNRQVVCQIQVIGLLALLSTAGCAGLADKHEIHQYLDESTGVTVTGLETPLAFFNAEPMLAANARDYVYVGPAELNRTGKREIVLWMKFCSTIDRGPQPNSYRPDKVFLLLDDTPMELAEADHQISVKEWSYDSPVIGGTTIIYRLTRGQTRLLATAGDVRVLGEKNGGTREYARWGNTSNGFQRFASYLDDEAQYFITSVNERQE